MEGRRKRLGLFGFWGFCFLVCRMRQEVIRWHSNVDKKVCVRLKVCVMGHHQAETWRDVFMYLACVGGGGEGWRLVCTKEMLPIHMLTLLFGLHPSMKKKHWEIQTKPELIWSISIGIFFTRHTKTAIWGLESSMMGHMNQESETNFVCLMIRTRKEVRLRQNYDMNWHHESKWPSISL